MTLEEIETLAYKVDASVYHNDAYGESSEAHHLALAVLKMLPVVRAAERYRDNGACYAGVIPAVDDMRAAFGTENVQHASDVATQSAQR